ncbi:MAG: SDR family oxidoreductase [Pseudomonadota bacterium]
MDFQLSNKRFIVTGGSRGIGRATVSALLASGARVATCARGTDGLERLRADTGADNTHLFTKAFDIRDPAALEMFIGEATEALGGLDGAVSNVSTRIDPSSPEWWLETFDTDLKQHVLLKELCVPEMISSGGGSLVFVASVASVLTTLPPYEEAYGAMKAALVNLTGQWANVLAAQNIRINAVSPGPVYADDGWWGKIKATNPEAYERAVSMIPMKRLATPDEIANVIAFLSGDNASYVTGTNIRVDGGLIKSANF